MEDVVDAGHRVAKAVRVPHVADVERELREPYSRRMSSCFFSSRLKMRISRICVFRNRRSTALPKEPVPPVTRRTRLSNMGNIEVLLECIGASGLAIGRQPKFSADIRRPQSNSKNRTWSSICSTACPLYMPRGSRQWRIG